MNRRKRKKAPDRLPLPTASEAAFEKLLSSLDSDRADTPVAAVAVASQPARDDFIARLYDEKERFLAPRTIGDAERFNTKVVGVSFEGRQDIVAGLQTGATLTLERQPANQYDPNAVAVFYGTLQLGYIKKEHAVHLAPKLDAGIAYRSHITSLTGGGELHRGVNILVERVSASVGTVAQPASAQADAAAIRAALIGDQPIRAAQHAVLERLDAGKNTLAVLGTARGKSFCFQYPAALRALESGRKTIAIYPLRALANDQYEATRRRLGGFGLRMFRANGSIDADERAALMDALREGTWDLLFATPEFLQFHRDAFSASSLPSLVVVDEAHHLYESRQRPAYGRLRAVVRELGAPQVLALTATARDDAFAHVVKELAIDAWVIDPTVRENLQVMDAREADKAAYLRDLFEGSGRGIVYCNSRSESVKVAERLRIAFGNDVIYYHGRLGTAERLEVERMFRDGEVRVVVATTAFGEGIDLPDVREVVLYHLNFNFTEFNQQAGRAGRDGQPARIHLLFGERDRGLNEFLINQEAPTLPVLREIYRGLRGLSASGEVRLTLADIHRTLDIPRTNDVTMGAAVRIFEESGLVETASDDDGRFIRMLPASERVDLTKNEQFAEGEAERENFARFAEFVLTAGARTLESIINRPIYPRNVALQQ
jgi:single-stranded-DNA-specific exonuclease